MAGSSRVARALLHRPTGLDRPAAEQRPDADMHPEDHGAQDGVIDCRHFLLRSVRSRERASRSAPCAQRPWFSYLRFFGICRGIGAGTAPSALAPSALAPSALAQGALAQGALAQGALAPDAFERTARRFMPPAGERGSPRPLCRDQTERMIVVARPSGCPSAVRPGKMPDLCEFCEHRSPPVPRPAVGRRANNSRLKPAAHSLADDGAAISFKLLR
jgi:hypothetical protein